MERYSYLCEQSDERGFPTVNTHRVIVNRGSKLRARISYLLPLALVLAPTYSLLFSAFPVALGFQWLVLICGLFLLVLQRNGVEEEAVVVMPTFGVQLETTYFSGKVHRQFVPLKHILAAVINEAVTPTSCYYYLALLVRDDSKLILAFKEVRPPLHMLVPIWRALREAIGNK
ncbi:hypothetical protein KP509_07G070200 [Ceratopteris richardii]|uniref:Phosphatidylinositol N-acetylglucosaminyltransferase subunit H conserved domain-containing protein n=1 Tax=Ceratopteris richardii TaxID=49495 RepID=A0A8T2UIV2_CERRI|nr:hypothetical protein KP509_07G070200 [Ceratopteris richardii]KAH7433446.1 hypothetical protein KP509_07G070200 [Ceratopteris richardii]